MIPRIKRIEPVENYCLSVEFDDGKKVLYDVKPDMNDIKNYRMLADIPGLFNSVRLDESRTCIFRNDEIDLPSDTIYEYGEPA